MLAAPRVAVVGGGPAGLMAAEVLARGGASVSVYDHMPTLARKLLLAGRGGLNLTHSEPFASLLTRYGAASDRLSAALAAFSPQDLRNWSDALGEDTFVGTSGRVFPRSFKASPLLRAWLRRLGELHVEVRPRHRFIGWNSGGALQFQTPDGPYAVDADAAVLALGGASWPRLGSDGSWVAALAAAGVGIAPLRPANCGFVAAWSDHLRDRFAGAPLKRIELRAGEAVVRGEAVITAKGIEGGGIYALAASLRDAIARDGQAMLHIGLRPDLTAAEIARRLAEPRGKASLASHLRKTLSLPPVAIALLHEVAASPVGAMAPPELATLISDVPIALTAPASIDRAISTAGGIQFEAVDETYMLTARPGTFVAGEMLDWEAPTGGYLLQACFATGASAGRGVLAWLARSAKANAINPQ